MMTNEVAAKSTKPKPYLLSLPYLLGVLGMLTGNILPGTSLAHKILMSCGAALLAVAYRRTPYLLPFALLAVLLPLVEFHLIGKVLGLVGISLFVLLALFTWLRQRRRKGKQQ